MHLSIRMPKWKSSWTDSNGVKDPYGFLRKISSSYLTFLKTRYISGQLKKVRNFILSRPATPRKQTSHIQRRKDQMVLFFPKMVSLFSVSMETVAYLL